MFLMFTVSDIFLEFHSLLVLEVRKKHRRLYYAAVALYVLFPTNTPKKMIYFLRGQRVKDSVMCSFIIPHMVKNISKYGHVALNIGLLYTTVFL